MVEVRPRCVSTTRMSAVTALLSCVLLLLLATPVLADGHTLSGTVYGNGTPLANTLVEALNDGTTTVAASVSANGSGQYSLVLADNTTYDLRVSPPAGSGFAQEVVQNIAMGTADRTYDVILLAAGPGGGGGAVSGTIRGADNQPLPWITVHAYATDTGAYITSAQSDTNGHYALTSTSSNIRMYFSNQWNASPYAPPYWDSQRYGIAVSGPTAVDVTVPLAHVSGVVKGSDDALIANAPVSASVSAWDPATQTSFSSYGYATSGPNGQYSMLLTPGSGSISAAPPNDSYWATSASLNVASDTTQDLVLPVRQNSTISGTIRGLGGNPLPYVSVYAYSQDTGQYLASAQSDSNGHYSLSAANGTVRLYMSNQWNASPYAPAYWDTQRYGIVLSGPTTVDTTLTLVQVTGIVKGSDDSLVAGASVSASSSSYDPASQVSFSCYNSTSTAADGSYSMMMTAGSGGISVGPPNDGYWPTSEAASFETNVTHDLTLQVRQNSTISGTIRGAGGHPIPWVTVYAYSQDNGQYLGGTQSDSNGFYSLRAANGTVRVYMSNQWNQSVHAPAYWDTQRYGIVLSGPTTLDVNLPLVTVSGVATDSNGSGVPNVNMSSSLSQWDAATQTSFSCYAYATTIADGTYSMLMIPGSGSFSIGPPSQSGFSPASLPLNLSGDLTQRIILQHPDLVAPQIVSGPIVVHLSANSVSISWTTNEASSSRVEFGIGGMTLVATDSALVTRHEITLQNLTLSSLYQFRVGSTDGAGNGPTYSAQDTFETQAIPDSTPPVITDGPTVTSVDQTSAIIQWSTDEPATTNLSYGLDASLGTTVNGDPNRFTVSHSVRLTGLSAETSYSVKVTSADPDANAVSSSIFSFATLAVPDTFAPIITSGPTVSSITDTKMTVSWTTDEPSTSGVSYNDGTRFDLVNDPALTRNHQITISGLTPSTTYFIRVSSTDANFNGPTVSGTISATTQATPDTTAPAIADIAVSDITVSSATISWVTSEPANSTVRYGTVSGSLGNVRADGNNITQHQLTLTGLLENTVYFFTVASTDASGNSAVSAEGSFRTETSFVDQPPSAPGPITAPSITNATEIAITWGASFDDVALASYEVLRNGVVIATVPPSQTTYLDAAAGEGAVTYQIRAIDSAGNSASSDPATVVVDRTAPVVTAGDVQAEATGAQTPVTYEVSASDNVDASVNAACTPVSGSLFNVGSTSVTCSATDAAGNTGSASFEVVVEDTTVPALNIPSALSQEAESSAGAVVTFTVSASDLVDGSVSATCSPASGSTFPLGVKAVTCKATDAAGNEGVRSFDVTITDTIAPEMNVPTSIVVEATGSAGAVATFSASATDIVSGTFAASCSPASGSMFGLGVTQVMCTATDGAGNAASAHFNVIVQDTTAPAVTVPADMTVEAANSSGGIAIFVASASDVVSGSLGAVCNPASGSTFPFGVTTVTCTSTDGAGNEGSSSFKVTVRDTTAPAIGSVTPSQSVLWPPDHRMVALTVAVAATDRVNVPVCSISGITSSEVINGLGDGDMAPDWSIGSGLTFQLRAERSGKGPGRTYTVTVSCRDSAGNQSSSSTTVKVPKNQSGK